MDPAKAKYLYYQMPYGEYKGLCLIEIPLNYLAELKVQLRLNIIDEEANLADEELFSYLVGFFDIAPTLNKEDFRGRNYES